jgi:hypothetical protein
MRPIFTVHAGEFLVGQYIEKNYPKLNVWIPSKDTGVDLLVTNKSNSTSVSLQVKLSRDYGSIDRVDDFVRSLNLTGWFSLEHNKINRSTADYWVFILVSHERRANPVHIVIEPQWLLRKLTDTHGLSKRYNFYPWVMKNGHVLDGRGLSKQQKLLLLSDQLDLGSRDFSDHLSDWGALAALNKS